MTNCSEILGTKNKDLQVQFRMKRRPRFKAGAELSAKVNLVAIEVNEENDEDSESFEMNLRIERVSNEVNDWDLDKIHVMQRELEGKLKCLAQLAECKESQNQSQEI